MDQYLATVIVAIITGLFSVATIIIQKRQDKMITKIDEQTAFMDKEQDIRKRLTNKEKEREQLMHEVMILVLDTNLQILKDTHKNGETEEEFEMIEHYNSLKERFQELTDSIVELNKEYEIVLEMTTKFRAELSNRLLEANNKKK